MNEPTPTRVKEAAKEIAETPWCSGHVTDIESILLKHLPKPSESAWIDTKITPSPDDRAHERLAYVSATVNHQRGIVYTHWRELHQPPIAKEKV